MATSEVVAEQPQMSDGDAEARLGALMGVPDDAPARIDPDEEIEDDLDEDTDQGDEPEDEAPEEDGEAASLDGDPLALGDEVEFEHGGKKYTVPKPLVENAMRQERFNQEMKQVAEQRQYVAQQTEALNADYTYAREVAPMQLQAQNMASQIEALQAELPKVAGDRDGYQQLYGLIESLKAEHKQVLSAAEAKAQELASKRENALREMLQAGDRILARDIPNWSRQTLEGIMTHAQSQGYTPEEVRRIVDPRFIKLAHDSMELARIKAGKGKVAQKVAKAAPIVRPRSNAAPSSAKTQTQSLVKHARKTGSASDAEAALTALMRGSTRKR